MSHYRSKEAFIAEIIVDICAILILLGGVFAIYYCASNWVEEKGGIRQIAVEVGRGAKAIVEDIQKEEPDE